MSSADRSTSAELAELASDRAAPIERFLEAARELLGVDASFVGEFHDGRQVYTHVAGDVDSFGLDEGTSLPVEATVCQRVVDGRVPQVIPDTAQERALRDLDAVHEQRIACYVGVPLRFSDGRIRGMFCCLGHEARSPLGERELAFLNVLARIVSEQMEREELAAENQRLHATSTAVEALLSALEARDGYTGEHSREVVALAGRIARQLDLSEEQVVAVEQVALLHDMGKLGVPDAILRKPGRLDDGEWAVMAQHPVVGARVASSLPSVAHLARAIRAEHERWDGRGYPDGLAGEAIPIESRITLVADAFHAMTSDRPYRRALARQAALAELRRQREAQFCPHTVDALFAVLADAPARDAATLAAGRRKRARGTPAAAV